MWVREGGKGKRCTWKEDRQRTSMVLRNDLILQGGELGKQVISLSNNLRGKRGKILCFQRRVKGERSFPLQKKEWGRSGTKRSPSGRNKKHRLRIEMFLREG